MTITNISYPSCENFIKGNICSSKVLGGKWFND